MNQYLLVAHQQVAVEAAETLCLQHASTHLASIHSARDQSEAALIASLRVLVLPNGPYIGLMRERDNVKATWHWTDGTTFNFDQWATNEPGDGENAVRMNKGNWHWQDFYGENLFPFMCALPSILCNENIAWSRGAVRGYIEYLDADNECEGWLMRNSSYNTALGVQWVNPNREWLIEMTFSVQSEMTTENGNFIFNVHNLGVSNMCSQYSVGFSRGGATTDNEWTVYMSKCLDFVANGERDCTPLQWVGSNPVTLTPNTYYTLAVQVRNGNNFSVAVDGTFYIDGFVDGEGEFGRDDELSGRLGIWHAYTPVIIKSLFVSGTMVTESTDDYVFCSPPTQSPSMSPTWLTEPPTLNPTNGPSLAPSIDPSSSAPSHSPSAAPTETENDGAVDQKESGRVSTTKLVDDVQQVSKGESGDSWSDAAVHAVVGLAVSCCVVLFGVAMLKRRKKRNRTKTADEEAHPKQEMSAIASFSANAVTPTAITASLTTSSREHPQAMFVQQIESIASVNDVLMDAVVDEMNTPQFSAGMADSALVYEDAERELNNDLIVAGHVTAGNGAMDGDAGAIVTDIDDMVVVGNDELRTVGL